ncbi:MAG: cyclase family protein, partial [Gammaproteobacteria bacterium]|nr:cyclase family protein [Gammaproteobacteria bacterium]
PVMPQDLEDAESSQGVRVEEGDILLVRTGNYRKRLDLGCSTCTRVFISMK